ncbi:TfoX/Sxy family protein [Nocardioides coralli]|uniref:TfoX/Sxy family protein n=1 Tax=Nocardioides coralli TaxID=2872154 RepID=UPI001CA4660F|nr:TfoX/Sxy family protein [Nocardioides coralli]QZY30123.1 TfoX/Sxy family protein [Nocardioides coralli]
MGDKGARANAAADDAAEALVADLQELGPVTSKRMFGGQGVFCDGVMFALVDTRGDCYLRVDDETRGAYEAAGSAAHGRMPYWTVPPHVREDPPVLVDWAGTALEVARRAKK